MSYWYKEEEKYGNITVYDDRATEHRAESELNLGKWWKV